MAFWVYILKCADGSYYTGHTDNLEVRLGQHTAGQGGDYTRRRLPISLAYSDYFEDRDTAFHAEHRIKNWSRAKKEALFARDWQRLSHFARPPSERPASLDFARDERLGGELQVEAGQNSNPLIPSEVEGRTASRAHPQRPYP